MTTHGNSAVVDPPLPPPGCVEFALQILRRPDGGYALRVIKRTTTWSSEIDARTPRGRLLSLRELSELVATLSDAVQSELLSRQGVQLSLGEY